MRRTEKPCQEFQICWTDIEETVAREEKGVEVTYNNEKPARTTTWGSGKPARTNTTWGSSWVF